MRKNIPEQNLSCIGILVFLIQFQFFGYQDKVILKIFRIFIQNFRNYHFFFFNINLVRNSQNLYIQKTIVVILCSHFNFILDALLHKISCKYVYIHNDTMHDDVIIIILKN